MTTMQDIERWLEQAPEGTTHMVVMCDTFDRDNYPVYCRSGAEARKKRDNPGSMQKPIECYKFDLDINEQIRARRALNWED